MAQAKILCFRKSVANLKGSRKLFKYYKQPNERAYIKMVAANFPLSKECMKKMNLKLKHELLFVKNKNKVLRVTFCSLKNSQRI